MKQFAEAVRRHWSFENGLRWPLDVTLEEDQCQVRQGDTDASLSLIRRQALSLMKNERIVKGDVKASAAV